jgi:hypothetical protein
MVPSVEAATGSVKGSSRAEKSGQAVHNPADWLFSSCASITPDDRIGNGRDVGWVSDNAAESLSLQGRIEVASDGLYAVAVIQLAIEVCKCTARAETSEAITRWQCWLKAS